MKQLYSPRWVKRGEKAGFSLKTFVLEDLGTVEKNKMEVIVILNVLIKTNIGTENINFCINV